MRRTLVSASTVIVIALIGCAEPQPVKEPPPVSPSNLITFWNNLEAAGRRDIEQEIRQQEEPDR